MLKLFRRKKRTDYQKPPERSFISDLSWPLRAVLKIRLNPFAGRVFFHDIICMAAKMASVDGPVSEIELKVFMELLERVFSLNGKQRKKARGILFEAHKSKKSFGDFAQEFYRYFRREPAILENAVDVLCSMVYADNVLSLGERTLLAEVAEIFKLSPETVSRITGRHHRSTTVIERQTEKVEEKDFSYGHRRESEGFRKRKEDNTQDHTQDRQQSNRKKEEQKRSMQHRELPGDLWYAVLGVSPTDTPAVVKKRYRKLALQYHPDKLPADIPEVMKRASKERFLAIQKAYEQFQKL